MDSLCVDLYDTPADVSAAPYAYVAQTGMRRAGSLLVRLPPGWEARREVAEGGPDAYVVEVRGERGSHARAACNVGSLP
jgi:hypothetical protein